MREISAFLPGAISLDGRKNSSENRAMSSAALSRPAFRKFKRSMDYNAYGGAPLLGVEGAVIKAHGSSGETAIMNAVRQAREMLAGDVAGKISAGLSGLANAEESRTEE